MEQFFQGKPPWKRVEWIRSPSWASVSIPEIVFGPWKSEGNEETLNVKDQIGALDKEHKWELAKKMVNPYELVYTHNDERLPPSLSLDQPLSRSYYKMVEILEVFQFFQSFEKQSVKLRTAHVAEGPGGFIQALTYRAQHYNKNIVNSCAMTLRPTSSHVPGWKKATAFLQKYKHVKIHYGADGTGDIYVPENQKSFREVCDPGGVHIFTADGGFDFSVDYSCQEQKVFQLLVNSAIIGLGVLKQGGYFVLKLFDCASPSTQILVTLLGRCFGEWTLYKPAMTRPCNSERYFLGKAYRGPQPHVFAALEQFREQSAAQLFPVTDVDWLTAAEKEFFSSHNQYTISNQIQSINGAIHLSQNQNVWWSEWLPRCIHTSYSWCETFRMVATPKSNYLRRLIEKYPLLDASLFRH